MPEESCNIVHYEGGYVPAVVVSNNIDLAIKAMTSL